MYIYAYVCMYFDSKKAFNSREYFLTNFACFLFLFMLHTHMLIFSISLGLMVI